MKPLFLAAFLGLTLLQGCIVYRIDVQQGNEITREMLDQLEIGMTKRDVTRVLGYPLVNDPFHTDRWDYYFYLKTGKTGEEQQQSATLLFEGDRLSAINSSLLDEPPAAEGEAAGDTAEVSQPDEEKQE